jgi:hypothetical protein
MRGPVTGGAYAPQGETPAATPAAEGPPPPRGAAATSDTEGRTHYQVRFRADAAQLFRAFPAPQNLADRAAKFSALVEVDAEAQEPFDRGWLRNAVTEHLDEADIDAETRLY